MTVGEALVGLLEQHGVRTVFGIPGVHTLELYRGLAGSSIRHVTPRHEQGAGFMADAWARVTGSPGVCFVISGPGVTNVLTPIAQAYHDSKPVLVISGVLARDELGRALGNIHELPDQQALMAQVTAFSHTVTEPDELPEVLARAFAVFETARPRPVHIEVPVDVAALPCGPLERHSLDVRPPAPSLRDVGEAAEILRTASAPVIVLGGGAVDAGGEAIALAELLHAPIGLSINAKGMVPDTHPLCVGATLGFRPVSDLLQEADAVVLAGAQLSELDLWGLERPLELRGKVIRIDIDADQLRRRVEPAVALHGTARATLALLLDALQERRPASPARHALPLAETAIAWPDEVARFFPLLDVLDRVLPEDRIVAGDSTQPAYAANHALPMHRPRSWLMPIGYGSLGCALPMAIGAHVASPERPVLCLVGDGGMLFSIQELATARDLGLPLPVLLWNNQGYQEIRDSMGRAGIEPIGTDATAADFATIARGFGCTGVRASSLDHLGELLTSALAADGPTVIDAPSDLL